MKKIIKLAYIAILSLSFTVSSCTKDADVSDNYDTTVSAPVANEALRKALTDLGYNFTDAGELIYDDKVAETTSLDLSGCELTSPLGLEAFEALEIVDLSDNDFGDVFNFNYLPTSIKEINLDGNNDLASYRNLVSITSGNVRLNKLQKMVLPVSAMTNFTDVVAFSQSSAGKQVNILVSDGKGGTTKYSTLREIPDPALKLKLQGLYPSIFDATGKVDLSKKMTEAVDLILTESYSDLTGVEYIICNPSFVGEGGIISITADESKSNEISWVKPAAGVKRLSLVNVSTPNGIHLMDTPYLSMLRLKNNTSIESLQIPSSMFKSLYAGTSIFESELYVDSCDKLTSVEMPEVGGSIGKIQMHNLAALAELDLKMVQRVHTIVMSDMSSTAVSLPFAIGGYLNGWGSITSNTKVCVALDADMQSKFGSYLDQFAAQGAEVVDMSARYMIMK